MKCEQRGEECYDRAHELSGHVIKLLLTTILQCEGESSHSTVNMVVMAVS